MRHPSLIGLCLLSCLLGCGEQGASKPKAAAVAATPDSLIQVPEDQVLATVGDVPVTIAEFEAAAARRVPDDGQAFSPAERAEILEELISEKMLFLEAKRLGIDRDPRVQQMMVTTLLRRTVYSQVRNSEFSDEELQAYFDAHPGEFDVPEKRQVKRIFVRAGTERSEEEAMARAEEARQKILADPGQFKDLAAEYSEDPYRRRGGDLGFLGAEGKPGVPAEIVAKAFEMEKGAVSPPFLAADGANVLYLVNVREPIRRTFQAMRGSVLRKVRNDKMSELLDGYVAQVKDSHAVTRNGERLAGIEIAAPTGRGPDLQLPGDPAGPEVDLGHGLHGGH